ncbi:sulfurtransferase TusA family protein [Candidatus Reidiella endopervernicosa]|uniref:Sulfurtransferase TusA family protein n=2 Tax=Candidatus Reidiella endopervernicosa TaxID=2738883 RepID=A0A6N0HSD2_9GAMM|nr:sulfurtransferase TusA family protein [Candidatus Reidiella endopervernicosa]
MGRCHLIPARGRHGRCWAFHLAIGARNGACNSTGSRRRGLSCPLPILRMKKAMGSVISGDVVKMFATDPGSVKDMEAFCTQTGNELIETGRRVVPSPSGEKP